MLILGILPKWVNNLIYMFLLLIDSVVYFFVSAIYQLFIYLSSARIFEDAFFANFANRIYAILGVFMLFYLAYALLNAMVDPEKLAKGDKSVSKLAQNLVISLVILGLLPSVFTYAYRLQNYVLSSNIIGALVLGAPVIDPTDEDQTGQAMIKFGDNIAFTVMNAFINPTNLNVNMGDNYNWFDFKKDVLENSDYLSLPALSDAIAYGAVVAGSGSGQKEVVTYYPIFSTATGIYLIYILLSFTLDLGVRIIKLAFCQLIAPIPVIMRAMPSKKGTFDKWLKLTLSVYFEVFIRVGIMYISVYFIKSLVDYGIVTNFIKDGILGMLALVAIILGIFTFAKQAPKLLSDTLGFDSANMKLGIGEKLKASGFLGKAINNTGRMAQGALTGALGGFTTGLFNRNINTWAAMRQGFSKGFASGGSQFSAQRKGTFEGYYGYNVKQGMFGGKSFSQQLKDHNGSAVADRQKQDQRTTINKYESSTQFTNTYNLDLNNGTKFKTVADGIKNNASGYKKVFDEADRVALQFAQQNGIAVSDQRAQKVREDYLKNIANTTTDVNAARAINSAMQAETMSSIWNEYEKNIIGGKKTTEYFTYSDTAIKSMHLSDDEKKEILKAKEEWLAQAKGFTEGLADGKLTRNDLGKKDEIYNKDYSSAHGGITKPKETQEDLLRRLINKSK